MTPVRHRATRTVAINVAHELLLNGPCRWVVSQCVSLRVVLSGVSRPFRREERLGELVTGSNEINRQACKSARGSMFLFVKNARNRRIGRKRR